MPDAPSKRAGSSGLRGVGHYHPPPGGARTPRWAGKVEVAGAGSRRVLGCSDCSIPSGGVCVFLEVPCSFCWGEGGAWGAAEGAGRGGAGSAGGPWGKPLWRCPWSHCKVAVRSGSMRGRSQSGAGGPVCVGVCLKESRL